jgi:hypothetical protein
MTVERAQKIAATLVKQFSKERFFAISLPKLEDLKVIADTLETGFHCTVVWNYQRSKISVFVPEPPLEEEKAVVLAEPQRMRMSG